MGILKSSSKRKKRSIKTEGASQTRQSVGRASRVNLKKSPVFAHQSEEEFAKILDYYRIRWLYEPRTFPLAWDQQGRVIESFTPDFFLPEFNLYLELTTLKQRLVTKKNHKLRRLKELYPKINIRLFYARDFRNLMIKYGLAGHIAAPDQPIKAAGESRTRRS